MKIRKLYIFIIIAIVLTALIYRCRQKYLTEYNVVESELNKIDGIKIVRIWGNEDLALEDIYATIQLKNGNTLGFYSLNEKDFHNTESISLSHINSWQFHKVGCDSSTAHDWSSGSLELGQTSEYAEIRKLNINSIKDVLDHFDTLKEIIDKISTYPLFDTLQQKGTSSFFQKYDKNRTPDKELKRIKCE